MIVCESSQLAGTHYDRFIAAIQQTMSRRVCCLYSTVCWVGEPGAFAIDDGTGGDKVPDHASCKVRFFFFLPHHVSGEEEIGSPWAHEQYPLLVGDGDGREPLIDNVALWLEGV